MNFLKTIINKLSRKRFEYLYLYTLDTDLFASEQYKIIVKDIYNLIEKDLSKFSKKIVGVDFYNDEILYETTVILTSHEIRNTYYKPIFYEIYAYLKKDKQKSVFSYKYEILNFEFLKNKTENKTIEILKLKVEC